MQVVNIRLGQYDCPGKTLRVLVGLLTGHNTLNRQLTLLRMDVVCKETGRHQPAFLGSCCAIVKKRCEFFKGIS